MNGEVDHQPCLRTTSAVCSIVVDWCVEAAVMRRRRGRGEREEGNEHQTTTLNDSPPPHEDSFANWQWIHLMLPTLLSLPMIKMALTKSEQPQLDVMKRNVDSTASL